MTISRVHYAYIIKIITEKISPNLNQAVRRRVNPLFLLNTMIYRCFRSIDGESIIVIVVIVSIYCFSPFGPCALRTVHARAMWCKILLKKKTEQKRNLICMRRG